MGGPENYEEAERHINEVELRVELSKQLDDWSKRLIPGLFGYLAFWFIVLMLVLFFVLGDFAFASTGAGGSSDLTYLFGSMVWGGIGGVIGALLPLIQHFSQDQDFDEHHKWWYLTSPPTGMAMGALVFLFLRTGLLSISGAGSDIASPIIIYITASLAGYQHNVFTDLIKRALKVLQVNDGDEAEEPQTQTNKG